MITSDIPLTCRYFQEGWGLGKMDNIYHVIPINEIDEHTPTVKCKCGPRMEIINVKVSEEDEQGQDQFIVLHNSFLLAQIAKANEN